MKNLAATAKEEAVDQRVSLLASFLQQDPDPMIVLTPDYKVLTANDAYLTQFGNADKPVIGRHCYQVSHGYDVPCDRAGEHCPMIRAKETKSTDRVLHIHQTPRGPMHVDVELRPILDGKGEILAFVERLQAVKQVSATPSVDRLVGRSPAFLEAIAAARRVAPSSLPVMLLGESGTGKELFARAVHDASDRAASPFVVVDCSGLTETLFESELFGYEKGSFTGANARKIGLVETAHGGTLFLDEVGDIPLGMQVKLLRLIEHGTYRRVGSVATHRSDFRLITATHQPLEKMLADGRFRQDLYYRISTFPMTLPPLRQRQGDIALLAASYLRRGSKSLKPLTFTVDALKALEAYHWPGNLRQLRNVIERARLYATDGYIRVEHLPAEISRLDAGQLLQTEFLAAGQAVAIALDQPRRAGDRRQSGDRRGPRMADAVLRTFVLGFEGTRRELAEAVGLSERTLYRRLRELGLE